MSKPVGSPRVYSASATARRLLRVEEEHARTTLALRALYEATHAYLDVTLLHRRTDPLADEAARKLNGALAEAFDLLHPKR